MAASATSLHVTNLFVSLAVCLQVLISSMASFASIVVLLVLFWLVFSIVGLHVFGGLTLDVPFPNCDTLINSLIVNFHVSQEHPKWLNLHQHLDCSRRMLPTLDMAATTAAVLSSVCLSILVA